MDLIDAINSRCGRAVEVRETYNIEQIGEALFYVQHPTEDERAYLVDMAQRTCDCPDFTCRAKGWEIDCKHIEAMKPRWKELTGKVLQSRKALPDNDIRRTVIITPDPNDPFKD